VDLTEALHPGWRALAERACSLTGVDVGGIDFRGPAEAFERPPARAWSPGEAALLEINVLPALNLHALPTTGRARPVFEAFVAYCLSLPGAPAPCSRVHAASGLSTSVQR
jgi:cyanophycin synthetase